MHDVIVIGGGPAALAAALVAQSKRLDARVIFEQPGGWTGAHQQFIGQAEDGPLTGEGLVHLLEQEILYGQSVIRDRVVAVTRPGVHFRVATRQHGELDTHTVIVATGASPIRLEVPGADEFVGHGLGYSATTYAGQLPGRRVAVIGITERALRGVLELAQTAAQVYVITHTHGPAFLPAPLGYRVRERSNVAVLEGYDVVEIAGGFNVEEVVVRHGNETKRIAVDAAFVDVGLMGNSGIVQQLVITDEYGRIKITERHATMTPGLFAAGDVTVSYGEQKLIAIGDGARAALTAYDYVLQHRQAISMHVMKPSTQGIASSYGAV